MKKTPIQKAVNQVGQVALADALGVTIGFVSHMYNGRKPVPASRAIAIEEATGGSVTRYDLRPDVFGKKPRAA